jgi:uncharacterized protein (DUF1697 family)
MAKAPSRFLALLRGINVGGKNIIAKDDLRTCFEDIGCTSVRTYIQSGNVIFGGTAAAVRKAPDLVAAGIQQRWGYDVPVIIRTAAELTAAIKRSPFVAQADPAHLSIAFLAAKPSAAKIATLDPDRSPGDRFEVLGREIHLYAPNGVARSRLTNRYFDTKLSTDSTARNWKTVHKLIELAAG